MRSQQADAETYMRQAVECAKHGLGHTFPNPAVGCVIVHGNKGVIGQGFHPRAGYPHAEVFALLEAAGHVPDGVAAALSVIQQKEPPKEVRDLAAQYATEGGPAELFGEIFAEKENVTAYVTLEPCCHTGKTPPCAASLSLSQVDRVVVGLRDPNPRVDGGGVLLLRDNGVVVDEAAPALRAACQDLVTDFCKRITLRPNEWPEDGYNELITGKLRRKLRSLAEDLKRKSAIAGHSWVGAGVDADGVDSLEAAVEALPLDPEWMEELDSLLWQKELVLLRLNQAIAKKKGVKLLAGRIAEQIQAHVAQTKGHTVLLYRPGIPPIIDLEELVRKS